MALCCFHVERTPSLHIWPSGHFKCYGCKNRGTDFSADPRLIAIVRRFAPERIAGTVESTSISQVWFRWEQRCMPAPPFNCDGDDLCSIRYQATSRPVCRGVPLVCWFT